MGQLTPDELAQAKAQGRLLYERDGLSAQRTADLLPFDVSRNQVVGWVNREWWQRSEETKRQNVAAACTRARAAQPRLPAPPRVQHQYRPRAQAMAHGCMDCHLFGEKARVRQGSTAENDRREAPPREPDPRKMECLFFWTAEGRAMSTLERTGHVVVAMNQGAGCERRQRSQK